MDEFLNSYAFEQMAKEYSQKYDKSKILVLNNKNDEIDFSKLKVVFEKIFRLFYLFEKNFLKIFRFKEVVALEQDVKKEIEGFCFEHQLNINDNKREMPKLYFFNRRNFVEEIFEDLVELFDLINISNNTGKEIAIIFKKYINFAKILYKKL